MRPSRRERPADSGNETAQQSWCLLSSLFFHLRHENRNCYRPLHLHPSPSLILKEERKMRSFQEEIHWDHSQGPLSPSILIKLLHIHGISWVSTQSFDNCEGPFPGESWGYWKGQKFRTRRKAPILPDRSWVVGARRKETRRQTEEGGKSFTDLANPKGATWEVEILF